MPLVNVAITGMNQETAMALEEDLVGCGCLYPRGLNMIPGGYTGIKYLGQLGFHCSTPEGRDRNLNKLVKRTTIFGRPNLLCASRWASDQEFVNSVICGHSDRLTVDQVVGIRLRHSFGHGHVKISAELELPSRKVREVISGATYSRVQ